MMKVFAWFGALLLSINAWAEPVPKLVLSGPPAMVSAPLIQMTKNGSLADLASQIEFKLWKNPDQMRLMVLGKEADVIAVPSNVAANLYNRGADIKLLNISTWGILYILSRHPELKTLADFKGEEIVMPFRADMPDLIFTALAQQQGLNPRQDFKLRYVASPMDAMQLLIMRRADHALLAEPVVSMALRKTDSFPLKLVAPELYRSLDIQREWGTVFQRPARIPQAGLAVVGSTSVELQKRLTKAYAEASQFCQEHPEPCAKDMAAAIPMLDAVAIEDALKHSGLEAVSIADAKAELEFFFAVMVKQDPKILGGKVPDAGFY